MINFTTEAQQILDKKYQNKQYLLKLLMGGCSGNYFDLFPFKKVEGKDYVLLPSNVYEVYTEMDFVNIVGNFEIKVDYLDEYGGGFLTIFVEGENLNTCRCEKSFFNERTFTLDLPYDNGLIGSFCQPSLR